MIWSDFFGYCSNSTTDLQAMSREIELRLQIPGLVTRVSQRIVAAGSGWSFLQKDWDAEVIVLFSGELLEKEAMCQEMSIPLNTPDPDVVLNTFLKKGDLCFENLKGVYSAAILEGSKALVYRDPIGARGLFYHIDNKGLTFSNRLPFVMANPLADEGLDEGSFHEYLRFLDICGPRTIFKNVFHLEPGSLLVYENGRCNIRELDLAKDQIFSAPHGIDEAADNLERLLREKIQ